MLLIYGVYQRPETNQAPEGGGSNEASQGLRRLPRPGVESAPSPDSPVRRAQSR